MNRPNWFVVLSAGVGLLLFLFFGSLSIFSMAWPESQCIDEGGLGFHILISKEIRETPKVQMVGTPLYYANGGDGPKPPSNSVYYTSQADPAVIHATIEEHLLSHGFKRTSGPPALGKLAYHKKNLQIYVDTETVPGKPVSVRVDEFVE